jgi:hypothetical protein
VATTSFFSQINLDNLYWIVCAKKLLESGEFVEDKVEGVLKPK